MAPAHQRRGIGRALLGRAMSENPGGLSLWAFVANRRAIAFYERAGFTPDGATHVLERLGGVTEVRYRLAW